MTEALLWFANHMHIFILVAQGIIVGMWLALLAFLFIRLWEGFKEQKRLKIVKKQLDQWKEDNKVFPGRG